VHTVSRLSGETGVHQRSTRLARLRRPIGCSAAGPVVAASSDPVISAWSDPVYGNIATLRHSGRVSTHYGHLASIDAKIRPGATVVVSARY
jgi:murein DD-endopeptidase MepM/ murein hydrolase activator NlpD